MVGAGFSRNAQKSVASIPEFPLWKDIAEKMFDALYICEKGMEASLDPFNGGALIERWDILIEPRHVNYASRLGDPRLF